MNTKFLLLIAFLLLVPTIISIAISAKKNTSDLVASTKTATPSQSDDHQETGNVEVPASNNQVHNTSRHHSEEDGKHHHFHFTRLQRRRCNTVWCMITKFILAIAHLSILFLLYSAVCH